jgi:tetratricopeptide (TPR) repeat protein
LTPEEQARFNRTQLLNPEAVDLYLQATQRLDNGNPADAIVLLRRALDKDSNLSAAHVSLARAYGWMGGSGFMPYAAAFSLQESEALKAIALDDTNPEPHIYLADAALDERWDWDTEEKELKRALEINANASNAHWAYAFFLSRIGLHGRAIAEANIAQQLDPVSFRSSFNLGYLYYYARQYDRALEQMQKAEAFHTNLFETPFPDAIIYVEKGLYDQSIKEFKRIGDFPHALGHLGNAYARQGRTAEARAILPKLREYIDKEGVGRYEIAIIYAGLGDKESAFKWLEQAYQARDKGMTYLKIDPCVDPLRSDPRFASLIQRVGFPDEQAEPGQ